MKMREAIEMQKLREMPKGQQLELRARNAVAELLIKNLVVPKIFFEAPWTRKAVPDVLAIDRGGTGDVHVVEIKTDILAAKSALPRLLDVPANFRWIAILTKLGERSYRISHELLNPQQGPGRIGVIRVVYTPDDRLSAELEVSAERFPGPLYDKADRFKAKHKADIEFR
ncbi:MAG: hypothetical protein WBQ43_16875 [Terriglobales bacterium]